MVSRVRSGRRFTAGMLALSLLAPLVGCGRSDEKIEAAPPGTQNAPYGYVPSPRGPAAQPRTGLSSGQKLGLLAGTAALIYLYNKHKNSQGSGAQGKYYLSRNGRVYYRDAKGNAIWVTPPKQGIQVPESDALVYERAAARGDWNPQGVSFSGAPALPGPSGYRGY
jgi:hypothetical protein